MPSSQAPILIVKSDRTPCFSDLKKNGASIEKDWHNMPLKPAARYLFWTTDDWFYFLAGHEKPPFCHPDSQPGVFREGLWLDDVAEFFLQPKPGGPYLEFNLSPTGTWWSCRFDRIRQPAQEEPQKTESVETNSEVTANGWQAMAKIPLSRIGPLEEARGNVCFILESPNQRFFTTATPTCENPDFHRPDDFRPLEIKE